MSFRKIIILFFFSLLYHSLPLNPYVRLEGVYVGLSLGLHYFQPNLIFSYWKFYNSTQLMVGLKPAQPNPMDRIWLGCQVGFFFFFFLGTDKKIYF